MYSLIVYAIITQVGKTVRHPLFCFQIGQKLWCVE